MKVSVGQSCFCGEGSGYSFRNKQRNRHRHGITVRNRIVVAERRPCPCGNTQICPFFRLIFGIIGMSGAGKSTFIRCINYLEHPTSGDVWIDGCRMSGLSERQLREMRKEIGMIFQHFNLLMQKNVLENICFSLKIAGVKDAEAKKRARELLEVVGLADKLQSQEPLQIIRKSCSVMRQPVHLTRRPQNPS